MNIGEAVKERILELCKEKNISINKLSIMSGVTQSILTDMSRQMTLNALYKRVVKPIYLYGVEQPGGSAYAKN